MSTPTSPMSPRGRVDLNGPPPLPSPTPPSRTLVDTQRSATGTGEGLDGGPQVMALQGMAMVEQGLNVISAALPGLSPALIALKDELRQVVPQAMAESQSEGVQAGATGMPPTPPPGMGGMPMAG